MTPADTAPVLPTAVGRWLLVFGVTYGLLHHQGFVLARLGTVDGTGTRWADWIDLATPYLVLAPLVVALALLQPAVSSRIWIAFATGATAYIQGHGIHLAANSVSNVAVDEAVANRRLLDVVHLWDELVGHYLWYGGLSLAVLVVVIAARHHRPVMSPAYSALAFFVAVLAGVTYATNALEGYFAWPGLVFAGLATIGLARHRRSRRNGPRSSSEPTVVDLVLPAFVTAFLVLGFYGCWHRGFPDPSSVGWNLLAR